MSAEKEVLHEMRKSLAEWGVQPNLNKYHEQFHQKAMATVQAYILSSESPICSSSSHVISERRKVSAFSYFDTVYEREMERANKDNKKVTKSGKLQDFPTDMVDAIQFVLRSQLGQKISIEDEKKHADFSHHLLVDRLCDIDGYDGPVGKPPFKVYDRYCQGPLKGKPRKDLKVVKRFEYSKVKTAELDPLKRFYTENVSKEEYFFDLWVDDRTHIIGNAFEAIVACHLVRHRIPCHHCNAPGTLQWLGGFKMTASWRDMVCINCKSSYEIKSKESAQSVSNNLDCKSLYGGSFLMYHVHQKVARSMEDIKHFKRKMFVVLVSRKTSFPRGCLGREMDAVWPVHIAEIDSVLPRVTEKTLSQGWDQNNSVLSISTKVNIKAKCSKFWFNIPTDHLCEERIIQIGRDLFRNVFSVGIFEKLSRASPDHSVVEEGVSECLHGSVGDSTFTSITDIRKELENLKASGAEDDWENLYSV